MNWTARFLPVLLLSLAACSSDSSLKEQYEAERMLFKAAKTFQKLMINPRIATRTEYDEAIAAYQQVLAKYPEVHPNETIEKIKKQCYVAIAELWLMQGETQTAIDVYDKFLSTYPDDELFGAFVHLANARSNEAIYNLNKAIWEYETLVEDFGQIQDPLKPNPNVLTLPLKVARLKRSNAGATNGANSYNEALQYYQSIVERWPKSPAAFMASYYMASIYADQQQWTEVVRTLNGLARDYPDREEIPNILLAIANVYLDRFNDLNMASSIADRLLKKFPDTEINGYVHFAKARVYYKKGKHEQARELLKWIIENFPEDQNLCASAQLTIASSYETEGNRERALVEYKWVQDNYPVTTQGLFVPIYIAENYMRRGETTLAQNSYREAISHYSNLVKKFPKTRLAASAQQYVIYCYSALQDWQKASEAAMNLKHIYPGAQSEMSAALMLGQLYERMKEYGKAVEAYEGFSEKYPHHPGHPQIQKKLASLRQRL